MFEYYCCCEKTLIQTFFVPCQQIILYIEISTKVINTEKMSTAQPRQLCFRVKLDCQKVYGAKPLNVEENNKLESNGNADCRERSGYWYELFIQHDQFKIPAEFQKYNKVIGFGGRSCVLASDHDTKFALRITTDVDWDFEHRTAVKYQKYGIGVSVSTPYPFFTVHAKDNLTYCAWLVERFDMCLTQYDQWLQTNNNTLTYREHFQETIWQTHLLPMMHKLHRDIRMVHGDLKWHLGNILLKFNKLGDPKSGVARVCLIDFEWSRAERDFKRVPDWVTKQAQRTHSDKPIFNTLTDFEWECRMELYELEKLCISSKLLPDHPLATPKPKVQPSISTKQRYPPIKSIVKKLNIKNY